jgi:hypothetical protein
MAVRRRFVDAIQVLTGTLLTVAAIGLLIFLASRFLLD